MLAGLRAVREDQPSDYPMTPLIYTIGKRDVYEPYIASDPNAGKGKGGSVWQYSLDALSYLILNELVDFSIYGVVAEWGVDTRPDPASSGPDPWHELLHDAPLRKL